MLKLLKDALNINFSPSDFGFDLNNREISALVYLSIFLVSVLWWKAGRLALLDVVRSFLAPKLLQVWLLMSIYVTACILLLARLSLWGWPNLKSTLLWWLTIGFTCGFEAQRLQSSPNTLRILVKETFTLSVIILFIAELESLPLWAELLMAPVLIFLTLLIAVSEHRTDMPGTAQVLKVLRGLQVFIGLLLLSFSLLKVATNITEHWSINTFREFTLPLLLWLMFIPFIFLLSVYMTYENVFLVLQVRPMQATLARHIRWRALFSFGWDTEGVKRLARNIRIFEINDAQGVEDTINEVKRLLEVEKKPPNVTLAEGWSPHRARRFLEEYGLITDDYHRTQWGWCAQSASVNLNDAVLPDRLSYYLSGNKQAVTRLRFSFHGSNLNDRNEAECAFDKRALTLLSKELGADRAQVIFANAKELNAEAYVIDGVRVSFDQSSWGDAELGGYAWNLTIQHHEHKENS